MSRSRLQLLAKPTTNSDDRQRAMLRRAGIPVPISDSELRAMLVRPVPVEPRIFSDTELAAFDPVYADDPEPPTPPLVAFVLIPFLGIRYAVLRSVAGILKLALRGVRAINRRCEEAGDRVTLLGILCVLGTLLVAYGAVCVAAFHYFGGAR